MTMYDTTLGQARLLRDEGAALHKLANDCAYNEQDEEYRPRLGDPTSDDYHAEARQRLEDSLDQYDRLLRSSGLADHFSQEERDQIMAERYYTQSLHGLAWYDANDAPYGAPTIEDAAIKLRRLNSPEYTFRALVHLIRVSGPLRRVTLWVETLSLRKRFAMTREDRYHLGIAMCGNRLAKWVEQQPW